MDIKKIRDKICYNKKTPELVEESFPKGECQERGKAIVLHANMLIWFADFVAFDLLKDKAIYTGLNIDKKELDKQIKAVLESNIEEKYKTGLHSLLGDIYDKTK